MKKKYIFKLPPHKIQFSFIWFFLIISSIILLLGLISLFIKDFEIFELCMSCFVLFLFIFIFLFEKLEYYEIYDDMIVVKNEYKEVNRVYFKDIKVVKIKFLSTDKKYTGSNKLKSFVFCDGRNEVNNTIKLPKDFDYFLNNKKVCVRVYYDEKLEKFLKEKNVHME